MSAVLSQPPSYQIKTLADYLHAAGISEFAAWANDVDVKITPRTYQVDDLNHMAAYLPRNFLGNEPGVGKTLPVQALILWVVGLGNKAVVVTLPGLVDQFVTAFSNNFSDTPLSIAALRGEIADRQALIDTWQADRWPDIVCMSYGTFVGTRRAARRAVKPLQTQLTEIEKKYLEEKGQACVSALTEKQALSLSKLKDKAVERFNARPTDQQYRYSKGSTLTALNFRYEALRDKGYTLCVADEAHTAKTPSSDVHQAIRDFVEPDKDNSNGLILMTGTPVETNVTDAYGMIALITPKRYGSMRAFDREHCILQPGVTYRKVLQYVNMDTLHASLYARGRRVLKKDVAKDLPPKVITEISVTLTPAHKKAYDTLVREKMVEIGDRVIDATDASKLYQLSQRAIICPERVSGTEIKDNAMFTALDELVGTLQGRKILVYAWYTESVDALRKHFHAHNPAILNGTITGSEREAMKRKFIHDPTCTMMVNNFKSGGVGIDGFQTVCSHAVFAEVCPYPGTFHQATDRLHRHGQTASMVNIYILVPRGTIAVKLRNDLARKDSESNEANRDASAMLKDLLGSCGTRGTLN